VIQNVRATCMADSCVANALDPIVGVITIITCDPSIPRIRTYVRAYVHDRARAAADCTFVDEDAVALRDAA